MKIFIVFCVLCMVSVQCKPSDLVAAGSKEYEQGAGQKYKKVHYGEQGEAAQKGYSGEHNYEKGEKGHHDKEQHQKQYAEEEGNKNSHHHNDGYYADAHKAAHGQKGYHFVDKGSYAKGHNTKGHHDVHKLEEFQKKKTFFDEDHDEGHNEKHGAFEVGLGFKNGAARLGGFDKKVFSEADFAVKGSAENGGHYLQEGGHRKAAGRDQFAENGEKFRNNESGQKFKGYSQTRVH